MSVQPDKIAEKISFCENHIDIWTTNATQIGTLAATVADLDTKTQAARDAYNSQQVAQAAAKAATLALQNALTAMGIACQGIIDQIHTKAATTANPGVYVLAQIPEPATPTRKPAPGTPSDFTAMLDQSGALSLAWKCKNARGTSGTLYQVYRRADPSGEFIYLGGSGDKTFVDATIPAGSSQLTYQIQAVRSTGPGLWAQFNVNFGVGGGAMTVTESKPTKIAA